jgi:phage shock protein C
MRRLYRSRTERKIAGVCGGLATYLGIDPVIPRLVWVAFALAAGAGLLAYLIFWIVVPLEPAASTAP